MMFDVRVEDTADDEIVGVARHLLDHALAADLQDDRFSDAWVSEINHPDHTFIAAVAVGDAHPVGFVGGTVEGGRLQLDALVSPHSRWDRAEVFDALLVSVLSTDPSPIAVPVDQVEVWGKPAYDWHESVLTRHRFREVRALQQMRCPLPIDAEPVPTRAFRPGDDDAALIEVNNRAFVDHPDQGGWTQDTLEQRMAAPWFDPDGVRMFERDGRLAGFCWTKIHERPPLGEIFAIGIDPDFHGQGLGVPMTAAGLRWLGDRGLTEGMLYVECDNAPAVRTYERLGFSTVRIDRAWRRD
ncbi:MAG: mycothiol synthase [Acidimicrobiales bacterium]